MAGLGLYGLDRPSTCRRAGGSTHLAVGQGFDPGRPGPGRDHQSDIVLLVTRRRASRSTTLEFGTKMENFVNDLVTNPKSKGLVGRTDPGIVDPFYLADNSQAAKAAQDIIRRTPSTSTRTRPSSASA